MKWSILILHLPARAAMLERLLNVLQTQLVDRADIELIVQIFNPLMPVGENREQMRLKCKGEYLNFIDDDDLVSEDYVSTLYPLLDGVDYVGFNIEQTFDGVPMSGCIERHSLQYCGVFSGGRGGYSDHYRDISHLNPMRRELSLKVPMMGWPADDSVWAEKLRYMQIVKTEHYVDRVLYYYLTRTVKTELADA